MAEEFKITEWIQKAKEDPKQFAIPIGVILAIGFAVYKSLYAPKALSIVKESKKNKAVQSEMKNFQSAANRLEDIKIDIEEKKKQWENTQKLCYKEIERTQFLRRIRELAVQSGIAVKSMNPQPDENVNIDMINAKKFTVGFSFNDNLTKLLTFMRLVELEPKICFMAIPTLAPTASGTFDTILSVSTILLPDKISTDVVEEGNDDDEEEE